MTKLIVIGGGPAGFFAALHFKETHPDVEVEILEKTRQPLAKVKISGGGRCNVTHACFDPKTLTGNYPRGQIELLGPFHRFQPRDTIEWFEKRGVALKVEADGRMFPVTDSSQTIIDCLQREAKRLGIPIRLEASVEKIEPGFTLHLRGGETLEADKVVLATGSSPAGYALATSLGHTLVKPVPSLFSFNCPSSPHLDLAGISVPEGKASLKGTPFKTEGPILITHWGFSGPAILKLSAFAARYLHEVGYKATVVIDWGETIPKNLLKRLGLERVHSYEIEGKTTYKSEFVTAGGVELKEINFKNMESKIVPGLYMVGELLNVDGITGGFNFQNAWTGGALCGKAE